MAQVIRKTVRDQIAAILRGEILKRSAGERLASIRELAERFSVSSLTVAQSMAMLVQEGLIEQRHGSGTYVRDRSKRQHVGVLAEVDISDPRTSYFYRRTPQQVVRFLLAHGVPARLYAGHLPAGEDSPRPLTCVEFLEALGRHQLNGVAAFAPGHTFSQWCEAWREQHIPVIGPSDKCAYRVEPDSGALGRMGGEYLLRQGRRRIALMRYAQPREKEAAIFLESFYSAFSAAGVQANPQWIRHSLTPCAPGAGWEELRAIWVSSREKPDGLFIGDDNLFPGAAMAICQLGIRVPEDLSVVTHWNKGSPMAVPFPVARLRFDPDHYVRVLGEMLIKLVRREPVANPHVAILCELLQPENSLREVAKSVKDELENPGAMVAAE